MADEKINGYELSRNYWNWAFDNPEKVSPNHAAIYFFAIEHCNRLGWKEKFGLPSQMVMDAIGVKKHSTYIRYFNDLVSYKFFDLIQKSKNQYSSNIVSLTFALPKKGEALDKAISKHGAKQTESMGQSKRSIDKQLNKEQINKEKMFSSFIEQYPNVDCNFTELQKSFTALTVIECKLVLSHVESYKNYEQFEGWTHPNALKYLEERRYMNKVSGSTILPKLDKMVLNIAKNVPTEMNRLVKLGYNRKDIENWSNE